jgi:type VI secretion system protein ImpL
MKPKVTNFCIKQLLPFGVCILAALFIWFDGPLITINGYMPLAALEKRLYLIALLFSLWLLKLFFIDLYAVEASVESISPEIKNKLQQLQGKFEGAIKFLKSNFIYKNGKKISLESLPWYLAIGPVGSGKTALLANANINYILAKQFKAEQQNSPSDTCDWWVTKDLVLVDVPGFYLSTKSKLLWEKLLQLLKWVRRKDKLYGVIVTLNLPELMQSTKDQGRAELFLNLKKRLLDVLAVFGDSMPIHLVVTKCDFLPGFLEFFGESSSEEVAQAWGITLPPREEVSNLLNVFSQRFNALIGRINKQLIWHLHHERNAQARPYIKDFPLHVEQLKNSLVQFLKALAIPNLPLASVHLTSSTQLSKQESNTTISTTNSDFSVSSSILSLPVPSARVYFVRQLIQYHLLAMPMRPEPMLKNKYQWQQRIAYAIAGCGVVAASILLGRDFQYSVQQAYSVQSDLAQYQLSLQQSHEQSDRLAQALPLLNSLRQIVETSTDRFSLAFYSNKAKKTANVVYHQALQTIVLPEIKNYFEKYLRAASSKNPEQVYSILAAYVMLADSQHFQADYIAARLQQLIPNDGNKIPVTALADHVHAALMSGPLAVKLDNALIAEVRKQLLSLSSSALAQVILKNKNDNNIDISLNLGTANNSAVFSSKEVSTAIPTMFTARAFNRIVNEDVKVAAAEALHGNWILGGASGAADQSTIDTLAGQLHTQYITNYVDLWESLLANIQLNVPADLLQLNHTIATLTGDHSPLLQLLDTIRANTALLPITAASPKLQSLSVLLANANDNKPSALYGVFVSLQELHAYLQAMVDTPTMDEAIYQATVQRMKNSSDDPITHIYLMAEQSPEPVKTWLYAIATKSWHVMLQETSQYIASAWQKEVMDIYHQDIANYYPFNSTSTKAVDLQQFSRFFGHQGVLTSFYSNYLQPFIDDTQTKLQWRAVNNQKPMFTEAMLEQLERAALLQQFFFSKGDDKLNPQAINYLALPGKHATTPSPIHFSEIQLPEQLM